MIAAAVRFLPAIAPALASLMLSGVASGGASAQTARPSASAWEESGEASWYGGMHNGRRMSNGAVFDDREMTAAHASLPLGSKVRVTVQDTGASVVVTITDRQPHKYLRVIDLSRGAASRLGMLNRGTAMVTVNAARGAEAGEATEVAEATGGDQAVEGYREDGPISGDSLPRRGRRHMRHAARWVSADRSCCRARFVVQVRHSVRRQATQRML